MRAAVTPAVDVRLRILVGLSLAASAVHFADNALRLDLYPGLSWFTPAGVGLAWLSLPALAWLALRSRSKVLLVLFALSGFFGFEHYILTPICGVALRCNLTIFGEAVASAVLLAYVLLKRTAPAT